MWVVDAGNHRVQEFTEQGEYVAKFGSYGTETGQFQAPQGIAVAGGHVWVTDGAFGTEVDRVEEFSRRKRRIHRPIRLKRLRQTASSTLPDAVAVDSKGDVWVRDGINDRIEEFSEATREYLGKFGSSGSGNGHLSPPRRA